MATQPTAGRAWRAARVEGIAQELWSGNVARLRPVELGDLLAQGTVPDMLTPLVMRVVFEGADLSSSELHDSERSREWAEAVVRMYDAVCRAAFVEPRIVDDPQADDEIRIDDLCLEDRAMVFQISTKGVEVLRRFRLRPQADVDVVSNGEGDRQPAQQVDGAA